MKVLRKKLVREIRAGKVRFIAASFLVFLATALFLATWLSYNSLDHSYANASEQLKYNDFIIQVKEAPDGTVDELGKIDGVAAVTARLSVEGGAEMPDGNNIVAQFIGMPTGSQPPVNQLLVEKGAYFKAGVTDACIPESHLADYYKIKPGDDISVTSPAGSSSLEVAGIAGSAEYFLVSSPRSPVASPENYGVLFVPQEWVQGAFGKEGLSNQFCFRVTEGGDAKKVMSSAQDMLSQYTVLNATLGSDAEARKLLDLDVQGFRQMSVFFPALFLLVAALSLYMILTRNVHIQRPQIGTMMAFGVSRRILTAHYFYFALIIGSVGAFLGLVAGYFMGSWMTHMYASNLGIPLVSVVMDWEAVITGFVVAVVICFLASILPIRRLVKLPPARVISDTEEDVKAVTHRSLLETLIPPLRKASLTVRIPLRNISRNRRRALLNILGITFAFILVLVSLSMINTIGDMFDFYYNDFVRYDANVYFSQPELYSEQVPDVTQYAQVKESSPYLMSPSRFHSGSKVLGEGMLQALPRDTKMLGFYGTDGKKMTLPTEGALVSNWFADGLGLKVGDTIKVETEVGEHDVQIKGFVKQIGGLTAFIDLEAVQKKAGADVVNGLLVTSSGPQGTELRDDLMKIPGAGGVELPEFTKAEMRTEYLGMLYGFAGIMILFAAGMALALIYNTINIAYLERETEIAVMLALGTSLKRVRRMFTLENMIVAVIAVIPGVLLGWLLSVWMWITYSSEVFSTSAVIKPWAYLVTIFGGLAFVLLAEWPSLRHARHIDIATMIRDRIR